MVLIRCAFSQNYRETAGSERTQQRQNIRERLPDNVTSPPELNPLGSGVGSSVSMCTHKRTYVGPIGATQAT